jgi:hypothetical protein
LGLSVNLVCDVGEVRRNSQTLFRPATGLANFWCGWLHHYQAKISGRADNGCPGKKLFFSQKRAQRYQDRQFFCVCSGRFAVKLKM